VEFPAKALFLWHPKFIALSITEAERRKARRTFRLRGTYNIVLGILYILVAAVLLYLKHKELLQLQPTLAYIICVLMALYGIFRLWRGREDLRTGRSL